MYICKICKAEFKTSRNALNNVWNHSCTQSHGLNVIEHIAELLPPDDTYASTNAYRLYNTNIAGLKKELPVRSPTQAPRVGGKHKKFIKELGLVYATSNKGLLDFPKEDAFKESILQLSHDDNILPGKIYFSFQNELSKEELKDIEGPKQRHQPSRYRKVSIYEGNIHDLDKYILDLKKRCNIQFFFLRKEIVRIVHQLVYIHYCMYMSRLMHGDLHMRNIKFFKDNNGFPIIKAFDFGNSRVECNGSDLFKDLKYFCNRQAVSGGCETFRRNYWRSDSSKQQGKHYPLHRLSMFLLKHKFSSHDVYKRISSYGDTLITALQRTSSTQNANMLFEAFSNDIVSLFYEINAKSFQKFAEKPKLKGVFCFSNLSEYHILTNKNYDAGNSVRSTKRKLKKMLSTKSSELRQHICTIIDNEKINLLTCIFSGRCNLLQNALLKYEIATKLFNTEDFSEFQLKSLSRLGEHDRKDQKYLNSTMLLLTSVICHDNNDNNRCNYDHIQFMRQVFKSISDEVMHPNRKRGILSQVNKKISQSISDLTFEEPIKYISESVCPGTIPLKNYNVLVHAGLDDSEFIILTAGVLKNFLNNPNYITTIIDKYYKYEYDEAKNEIKQILRYHRNIFPSKLCDSLNLGLINSQSITNKSSNSTRRYFETKLALYHLGNDMKLWLINEVISVFSKSTLANREQAEQAILTWSDSEKHERYVRIFYERALKKKSLLYPTKDRIVKNGFLTKRDLSRHKTSSQTVMSHQYGLMSTKDPYFADEITSCPQINRIPDIYTHSFKRGTYPMKRTNAIYNASLSGHMYFVVGLLEKFMSKYGSYGQEAVNEFLLALIAVYAKNGFHSNHEILDVLHEPHIVEPLKKRGINLNLHFRPYALKNALRDTIDYTRMYTTKRLILKGIKRSNSRVLIKS
ncbi:MAG: hypothetical protein GY756_25585 [bacterium]|nr:hypothetical protein [bacterium]